MPNTAHSEIADYVVALLAAGLTVDGHVKRGRGKPLSENVQRAVRVSLESADPSPGPILYHPTDWATFLVVQHYGRAVGEAAGEKAADALFFDVNALIVADPDLGGRVMEVSDPRISWESDDADAKLGCVVAVYELKHRTRFRALTA